MFSSRLMWSWIASALPCLVSKQLSSAPDPSLQECLPASVSERRDDVLLGEVCQVSLPKQSLDDLLRLSMEFSPVEAWLKAWFFVLFLCSASRSFTPVTRSTNISLILPLICGTSSSPFGRSSCHESQLRYQCKRQFSVSYRVVRIA